MTDSDLARTGWDVVVVGAGPAGCVLARRLADDGRRVVLVEAGPGRPQPVATLGLDTIAAAEEPQRTWAGLEVRDAPDGPVRPYRQGRGLGGGSTVNGLLLTRGDRIDYDRWRDEHGCAAWGAADVAPWLDRAASAFPGRTVPPGPVAGALAAAAAAGGHAVGGASTDQDRLGVLEARLAIDGQRRRSAFDAYIGEGAAAGRRAGRVDDGGPTVRPDTTVARVLTAGGRARGVALASGHRLMAPLVVVCGGAIATPALLARSGLRARPVGLVLRDHPSFALTLALRDRGDHAPVEHRVVSRLLRWSSGPDGSGDLQAFAVDRVDRAGDGRPLAVLVVGLMAPTSTGSVTVADRSEGPALAAAGADVVTGALTTESDRVRLRSAVRHVAGLLTSGPFDGLVEETFVDDRGTPIDRLLHADDGHFDRWLATHPGPYAHPASSCPMGPESAPGSVVGAEPGNMGRLIGYEGIVVADASVLPDLVRGGLQLPVVAVAERIAADLIDTGP